MSKIVIIRSVLKPVNSEESTQKHNGSSKENKMIGNKMENSDLESRIKSCTFTILPSGKTTVCELTLQNGFSVVGTSSCLDVKNFDKELGEKCALKDAKRKAFDLVAYEMQTEISNKDKTKKESESAQIRAVNMTIASSILDCIKEYDPLKSFLDVVNPSSDLVKISAENNRKMFNNIIFVLSNLQKAKLDFCPDLIFKCGKYQDIALGDMVGDAELCADIMKFTKFYEKYSNEAQTQFNLLLKNVDKKLISGMFYCK